MLAFGILFFFFFRLITDFVEAIYAFGLLGTAIPFEIVAVLFLFTPILLFTFRQDISGNVLFLTAVLVLAAGAVEAMLDTRGRMLVAGAGVGSFMVFLPCLISYLGQKRKASPVYHLGAGLTLGLALSVLFRAWNSGVDPASQWMEQVTGWILAIAAGILFSIQLERLKDAGASEEELRRGSLGRIAGLCIGTIFALTLLYFAFTSPNVLARWTEANYTLILALFFLTLSLFAVLFTYLVRGRMQLSSRFVLLWNVLFLFFMVAAILPHQIRFPPDPASYPIFAPDTSAISLAPLYLMILLFPIILLDFTLYTRELVALRPGIRRLAGGFTLASLFLLATIFAQVFTTVYDYIPFIGLLFRDRFWLVFLALGLGLALPYFLLASSRVSDRNPVSYGFAGAMAAAGVAALAGVLFVSAKPTLPVPGNTALKILTYNIQQGYSADGQKSHIEQLELMRQVDADLIGLQESDTNRIAGGNADLVRYFADRLNLYSYYGPKVVPGTFGIALLSKYPLENARTFYMYSQGEQTATISARIIVEGKTLPVFVTHLGNGGPMIQQEALLGELAGLQDVIAMGDFNFEPDTEQYRRTVAILEDAWLARWPEGVDDLGNHPVGRIDHIFFSPGMEVKEAHYLFGSQSDHPALVVEVIP